MYKKGTKKGNVYMLLVLVDLKRKYLVNRITQVKQGPEILKHFHKKSFTDKETF